MIKQEFDFSTGKKKEFREAKQLIKKKSKVTFQKSIKIFRILKKMACIKVLMTSRTSTYCQNV